MTTYSDGLPWIPDFFFVGKKNVFTFKSSGQSVSL